VVRSGDWLVVHSPRQATALRVVALPHAGGSAGYYTWLRDGLEPDEELVCAQYPGRQERRHEPPAIDIEEAVAHLADAVTALPPVPTILFGHSMGAALAFELALELGRRGAPVAGLVASGRRAPGRRPPIPRQAPDDAEVLAAMRRLGGLDPAVLRDPDVLAMLLPVLRADSALAESYRPVPGSVVDCPITVLTGRDDPLVSQEDAHAWAAHTTANATVHVLPGGHFFFDRDRAAVLGAVCSTVDTARQRA